MISHGHMKEYCNMYNYSIIIPHHNIPKLLERLLYSIPIRDDLEVIIVDDNSDKEIVDFELFPGLGRKNCKVIFDKKGGGGGYARNVGLKEATGKWILFADADDFFNYCLNEILDYYIDNDNDIVYFKVNSLDSDNYSISNRGNNRLNLFIDHYEENKERYTTLLKYKCGEPWSKIIKKEIIDKNHITFEETNIHNDHRFGYMIGYHARKVDVDKRSLYCVTTRKISVSKNTTNKALLTRIRIFGEAENFIRSHKIPDYAIWNWHITQLADLYVNKNIIFSDGVNILLSLGFRQKELNNRLYIPIQYYRYMANETTSFFNKKKNWFIYHIKVHFIYKLRLKIKKFPRYTLTSFQ